jgi:hypothetical protein
MGKMPYTDWKEWATKRPDWMRQDVATTFERFVERKWQDALNVAAAEPTVWSMGRERFSPSGGTLDHTAPTSKGMMKVTGAVNVVEQRVPPRSHSPSWDVSFGRKCRARNLIGCNGDHVLLQCDKLLSMELCERKEVLEKSGLCLFCLKHAAELECYGRGGISKPRCTQAGCDGEHTPSVHKLMGEEGAGVNLVAEDEGEVGDEEDEDEEWWVGTVEVTEGRDEGGEALKEIDESGSADEVEYSSDTHFPKELEEDGWWNPEPSQPCSEDDEEGVQRHMRVLGPEPWGVEPVLGSVVTGSKGDVAVPEKLQRGRLPHPRGAKRKRSRKEAKRSRDQEWEQARQDAWLRERLSDTSSSEEDSYGRFAESGRWISELFKIPQHPTTTSGGECSGQKTPDYS